MAQSTDLSNLDNQVSQVYATGALVIPVGTKAQRPANPVTGMLRWNSSVNNLELYGTQWQELLNRQQIVDGFVSKTAPVILADLDATGKRLTNVANPTADGDAVNRGFLNQRLTSGAGINADTLDGHDSVYFATQFDVQDLQTLVSDVVDDLNEHIADLDNPHQTTKAQVGLDLVDNTPDLLKPISNATQTALNTKVNRAGDTMEGALSMGYNNLVDIANFVGMVMYFATTNAPAGFLACNGAAVSRTNYSRLFTRIGTTFGSGNGSTTFNLPDLRGMFVRGWAPGGYPTDPGRLLGSYQADEIKTHAHNLTDPGHTHTGTAASAGEHLHEVQGGAGGQQTDNMAGRRNFAAMDYAAGFINDPTLVKPAGDHTHTVTVANSTTGVTIAPTGGAETRPMNVALLACIMY